MMCLVVPFASVALKDPMLHLAVKVQACCFHDGCVLQMVFGHSALIGSVWAHTVSTNRFPLLLLTSCSVKGCSDIV